MQFEYIKKIKDNDYRCIQCGIALKNGEKMRNVLIYTQKGEKAEKGCCMRCGLVVGEVVEE